MLQEDALVGARRRVPERRAIVLAFGVMMLTVGLAEPFGIVNVPILYMLKDDLGLRPSSVAIFEAIVLAPVYLGFLFGFLRDRWQPFGLGDRAYILMAAPLAMCGYALLAALEMSYATLLGVAFVVMIAFQFITTAVQASLTVVAQRHARTGGRSAIGEIVEVAPKIIALGAGGWLVAYVSPSMTFAIAAALTAAIALQALWGPQAIFARLEATSTASEGPWAALRRLMRHPPLWPTIGILFLWNFAPGWETPLFYYLSEGVGISSQAFGLCKAINLGAIAVTALLYGYMCERYALKRLLIWAVAINTLPGLLFLLIYDASGAVAVSAIVGLACGLGNVAVFDLLLRSCPKDLEGTATMLGLAALTAADVAGDLFGSYTFEQGGFLPCLVLDALATVLILPLLQRLPVSVLNSREGEQPAEPNDDDQNQPAATVV